MARKYITSKEEYASCDQSAIITDFETGEIFCSHCGFVLSERIEDSGPEWRSFYDDKTNSGRTGSGTSLAKHDQGLSTIINSINKDASGKPLSSTMKKALKQLRMLDRRSQIYAPIDKNFIQAFSELNRLKDKLALSNTITEKTAYIYRKAVERELVRGRTISAMIAAALYAACRDTETPRTLKDVAEASNIKRKDIARCYRLIYRELDLKMPVVNSIQCIARISSRLEITEKIKRYAIKVLKLSQEHKESAGKDPMGLAGAALYLSCIKNKEDKTQREIAEAANVTEVTIRNRAKSLRLCHVVEL
ncbi:MAG: transcription initiation factor IIB [Nitrosopumilus sp.]|nr:transcription initiation factor IIB [Nitrosopumilus sp.]MDH3487996.1 transcription initiation factor IIB [Nitrosopumilus sp.]